MNLKRILFVSEAVTLAQVVRLVSLAKALDASQYEVHFASASFPHVVFNRTSFVRHRIHSVSVAQVERAVERGSRIYGKGELRRYLREELSLIARIRPALIVGDLRWSLRVSAPLQRVPHAALINAYWHPEARRSAFPLPDHPIVRLLGEKRAAEHFPKALPFVFRHFARPLDSLRQEFGFSPFNSLTNVLLSGEYTLFPDVPELVGLEPAALPATSLFLGPVLWSPRSELPAWWEEVTQSPTPRVYVTLGSSGRLDVLPRVLQALSRLPVNVMVSTAGRPLPAGLTRASNIFLSDYLPGDLAARCADLVVCNGGSSTGYQALYEGAPVVGLPWNLDQYLAMTAISDAGAGRLLRSSTVTEQALQAAFEEALGGAFTPNVERVREALLRLDSAERFRAFVAAAMSAQEGTPAHSARAAAAS